MKNQYEKPGFLSKEDVLNILNGDGSVEEKVNAIIGAVNSFEDQTWLLELCLKYMNHQDNWVAGAAINGLGDIARIFGHLDVETVVKKLTLLKTERKSLAGKIDDAIDDIKTFMP